MGFILSQDLFFVCNPTDKPTNWQTQVKTENKNEIQDNPQFI